MRDPLHTPEEQMRISEAIRAAESETSGEVAVMIVPESDSYREAEVLGGILLGGSTSFAACVATGHLSLWTYIPLSVLFFFPWRIVMRKAPRLKLPLLSRGRIAHAVRQRAVRAFYEKGLHRTRRENGILIFLSLLERKVWILADRGIDGRIPGDQWRNMAEELTRGLRAGDGCSAICAAVRECGAKLRTHFPAMDDDTNELPDEVIR